MKTEKRGLAKWRKAPDPCGDLSMGGIHRLRVATRSLDLPVRAHLRENDDRPPVRQVSGHHPGRIYTRYRTARMVSQPRGIRGEDGGVRF